MRLLLIARGIRYHGAMFERLRFLAYALRFERAFRTDRWEEVRASFHPDATYTIEGSGTRFDGEYRSPDVIIDVLRRMLDEVDRKFDERAPRLRGWVAVRDGELTLPWKARYSLGEQSMWLTGTSRCRWSGGKIIMLRDLMVADEVARWAKMVGVT